MIDWYFSDWHSFWVMNGHGPFVWSAYAITLSCLLALVLVPWLRERRLLRQLRQRQRQQQTLQQDRIHPNRG